MSCSCRENKNIWAKYNRRAIFTKMFWKYRENIWHDSFGRFWNKFVTCRFRGHINTKILDCGSEQRLHCFDCEQDIWTKTNNDLKFNDKVEKYPKCRS